MNTDQQVNRPRHQPVDPLGQSTSVSLKYSPVASKSTLAEEPRIEAVEEMSAKESFTCNDIKTPEGKKVSSPQELAGVLVTYLYDVVPKVSESTRDSLKALDDHFTQHPPKRGFNNKFLLDEFIPALGAHLGGVLIESSSGEWEQGSRLLKSTVKINDKAFRVFEMAYEAVYEDKKLIDSFDACMKEA